MSSTILLPPRAQIEKHYFAGASLTNSMMRDAILGYVQGNYLQAKNLKSLKLILNNRLGVR